jgi:hypothetical protein
MPDFESAMIRALEKNVQRYTRLLSTRLTPLEQQYVKRRLAEERLELRRLRSGLSQIPAHARAPAELHAA